MVEAKTIEIAVTEEDLKELIAYYRKKESRTSSDRMMISLLEVKLDEFNDQEEPEQELEVQEEVYGIKTVGDLKKALEAYEDDMPVKKSDIGPSDIARLLVQDCKEYEFGGNGKVKSTYKALVIR